MRTVWPEQWFSRQIVPAAGEVSEIHRGGFNCHVTVGTGLSLGGQSWGC